MAEYNWTNWRLHGKVEVRERQTLPGERGNSSVIYEFRVDTLSVDKVPFRLSASCGVRTVPATILCRLVGATAKEGNSMTFREILRKGKEGFQELLRIKVAAELLDSGAEMSNLTLELDTYSAVRGGRPVHILKCN